MKNKIINMTKIQEWKVEGMTCTNCARTVSKFLERKGMEEVYVNVTTHEVRFENTVDKPIDELKSGISKLGFSVVEEGKTNTDSNGWSIEKKCLAAGLFTLPLFLGHIFMMLGMDVPLLENAFFQLALCLPVFIIGVYHFGRSAYHALQMGNTNMDVLIFTGSTAAFLYSIIGLLTSNPDLIFFETAATIITLVLIGNLMEKRAVEKTTHAIEDLRNLQSPTALRLSADGNLTRIDAKEIKVGDILQVNEGDAIPADGKVYEGSGWSDESMLTGETELVEKRQNAELTGASVLRVGNLRMQVTATGKDTVLNKIIDLVKNAQADEPEIQRLADRISAVFVPLVLGIAVLTILLGYFVFDVPFTQALMNAIAVLVISCPCAMGLATPAAIMVGVGRAAKEGILIKGSRTLEVFANVKEIVFDKTGTLTEGRFSIADFGIIEGEETEIRSIIKSLEQYSSHPIAQSLVSAMPNVKLIPLTNVQEIQSRGVSGKDMKGHLWEIGSHKILHEKDESGCDIFLTKDGVLVARMNITDALKEGAENVGAYFGNKGIHTQILSGDKTAKVKDIAQRIGMEKYFAEQRPEEKFAKIEELKTTGITAMVGDGINDAAALAKADIGVSFGAASDVAVSSSGIILLNDSPNSIIQAHKVSRHTLLTIKQNLFWAFSYNLIAIPVAAMGFLNPMLGALFMAFSDVVVIGNSLRLRYKKLD